MDKVLPGLALVCACGSLLASAGSLPEGKGERHTFYVHVYNYAHIGDSVLVRAEEEATRLFLEASVEPIWVACPLSQAEIDRFPECHRTKGLILNISSEHGLKTAERNHEFGFALQTTAYIFAGSLTGVVQSGLASWPVVLGHVAAHEIGHLMLGPNSHSPDGVMRPRLDPGSWHLASMGKLVFNTSQRKRIRSSVEEIERASLAP